MKLNKKQKGFLNAIVKSCNTKLELINKTYNNDYVLSSCERLGKEHESLWMEIDRYVSDKFGSINNEQ